MRSHFKNSKGSALAISLTILTAITLISVTALQRSGIQSRMVGNIQHKEQGFHAANSELEEIYNFYATQASATEALSLPLNSFDLIHGEQQFTKVTAGHTTTYNDHTQQLPSGYSASARPEVSSNIQHTGQVTAMVDGFSYGTFVEYGFVVSAQSAKPKTGASPGEVISDQEIGIKFIAPAG